MGYKIYDDSLLFSIQIVTISKQLRDIKERSIADQLLRSGTSIGANIREAKFAASDKDYIHKLRIALKEANETCYRLELIRRSAVEMESSTVQPIENWANKLTGILVKIIKSKLKSME